MSYVSCVCACICLSPPLSPHPMCQRRTTKREQYQFDSDLMNLGQTVQEGKAPPPPAPPPSTPAAAAGVVPMVPPPPTDSTPPTPTPRSILSPAEAAAAAAAAAVIAVASGGAAAGATGASSSARTPVYPPGPPLPGPAAEATTGPRASAPSYRSSNPSNTARALVFTGAAASGTAAATATAEAIETASHSSKTSKYESATSLYDKMGGLAAVGLTRYSTPAGSDGNLQLAAASASAGALMGPMSATVMQPQRLRSHRLSLSGSETVTSAYQTAYSRDSYSVVGLAQEPSGSYITVRSTNVGVGGNGGGTAAAASVTGGNGGSEGPSRAQSTGTFAHFASSPTR
ncbi:hypothetical protein Vafri_3101 [Volvox africanus]|uniref:Uncharacterized protein n=1 Tax=Volvox africanus TaxID=51714 RepID=A0A8J4ATP9_9CHLO|nr:hypothetical protein Vafri_3101 [Volvox africanus]